MAKLTSGADFATPSRAIPARSQLLAVAWLRWRMFANGFRRPPVGASQTIGLILTILLRIIVWPIFALMLIGPVGGSGFFAWGMIAHHHPQRLLLLLAAISLLWQFFGINGVSVTANISSFDPSSLMRFPLPFGRYLLLRTLLGLLTPSTVVGCLALLAAAIGISVADHSLALPALIVLAIYALMNVFFARMLIAWMERWLATRRAREIFGALMALLFVGIQFLNYRRAPVHSPGAKGSWLLGFLQGTAPFLRWLPPGFAANSILLKGHPFAELAQFTSLLACTALFLTVFALRLHKQFLGEYLSEGAARSTPVPSTVSLKPLSRPHVAIASLASSQAVSTVCSPIIAACLRKEWIYLRGNARMVIGMLTPLIFVFILSKGILARHPSFLLPGALGYVLFGLLAGLYNIFGADGTGIQLYLLAPIRLRDVILAKNIASLGLILVETLLVWIVVLIITRTPIPLSTQISAAFWLIFVIGANLTLGTLRSIQAPRKFVPGQTRQTRTPTNRTSSLLVLALLFGSILLQIPVTLLCRHFRQPWLAALVFAPLAAAAIIAYILLLRYAEQLMSSHRDLFAQELCGV